MTAIVPVPPDYPARDQLPGSESVPSTEPHAAGDSKPDVQHDGQLAEQAWLDGDWMTAITASDRVLVSGTDIDSRAAGVAAAAAAADGALLDAAKRWRGVSAALEGASGVLACGRAALAAGLAGDVDAGARDLAEARSRLPDPAPRGLTVLLEGADATVEAVRGGFERAVRRLAGLAAATVPPDMLASELWGDLVVTVVAAGGDDDMARAMLGAHAGQPTTRQRLLAAWLDMRAGRLAQARDGLAVAARTRVLRRNAVLAAAVTMGIARRSGDSNSIASTWHRVAPVVAGADVELLLLDAWGELSAGAAWVSPADRDTLAEAMRMAVARAGSPSWCVAIDHWWRLERAVIDDDAAAAAATAEQLTGLAADHPSIEASAEGATTWAAVLAGNVNALVVARTAARIAAAGRHWEAAALCKAAAARTDDPAAVRKLLGKGRRLRAETTAPGPGTTADGLSEREREVGALVVDGLTQKEIGARLYISPKTVEQHVARIRQKLASSNRAELVAALRHHLRASSSTVAGGSQPRGQAVIGSVRGSVDEQAEVSLRPQTAGVVGSPGSAVRPAAHAPAQSRRG